MMSILSRLFNIGTVVPRGAAFAAEKKRPFWKTAADESRRQIGRNAGNFGRRATPSQASVIAISEAQVRPGEGDGNVSIELDVMALCTELEAMRAGLIEAGPASADDQIYADAVDLIDEDLGARASFNPFATLESEVEEAVFFLRGNATRAPV